ncbi:type I restriction enzyme HsdR N-terminal domain-containing protein [Chitinophagaceae bacterium LB-8]|uniref:Type I restriction enzyme HsdR N-terminal domain-containing protein n=1 Tax=Paraflavisolibacter caeni TaxID=2982496 RepID=A0A9X2XVN5_9BACT|nr:type I restriction enzyme HsdR N-terminal domain-containing protein [Paraflavisolibacter caeni]MCU7549272.1 type I restriction enzyme HsdR N-terminal domain-containing protein [Paraflavisolibacter caeni]
MNEEEIRGKLLLPFLNDLGFDVSEISLEKSFSIKLGKSRHTINGRSDILCKRNGNNLFIVELKNDSISIEQEDIEQGISYARLLTDNIAPFTIITNGKTTRIFDSISRKELTGTKISDQSSYWQNDCTLSTDIDLRIRYEALKKFVSFSSENLKKFCEDQVRDRMGPIIGNINEPYAKFVKELHVQRQGLQNAFNTFTSSEASVFGIVGSAGVGKTNAMCSLALQQLENEFVFFYNAAIINKSPLQHIAQDLNVVFSSKSESNSVLKKLDELGSFLNRNILIFIDAIDESRDSHLAIELSEIALSIRTMRRVKICISCKANIWNNILKKNGTPTHLFEELSRFHEKISSADNCPGFLLEDFSDEEINSILPLYKEAFGFQGQISKSISEALRNGFFLRIFSEVYSQREVPQEINDKDLIKRYLKQSLEKTDIGFQVGLRILSKIGEILINQKYASWETFHDEGMEVESLIEKLEFSIDETIPEDLFARNILIRSNKNDSYNISFYYSKIRDYIICFHSYKLYKLSEDEFYDTLERFYENYIGQSAISFYLENASDGHKRTLIKFKRDKSLKYVNSYNSYLEQHFKSFKEKFDPQTKGDIGIFLPEDLLQKDGYALFPLDSNSTNKVQFAKLGNIFSNLDNDLFFEKGVNTVYGSNLSLLIEDQSKTVQKNIFKQLKEIIEKGRLSVYNSDILLLEQVSTILYYYFKELGYSFTIKDYYLPRFNLIYPIDLKNLRDQLYKFCVSEYYKRQYHLDPKVKADKIDAALRGNFDVPRLNIIGDFPPMEELFKLVEILLSKGYSELAEHHLPCPDISISETKAFCERERNLDIPQIRTRQFSKGQAKLYIETFLKHLDSCYKEFVEYCFPTFKDRFPFFMTIPHEYFFYMKDEDVRKWGMLGYRSSKDGEVKINFKKLTQTDEPFTRGETNVLRGFSLDQILHNDYYNLIKTIDKINTPKVDEFCVLRNWVYSFLKSDMETLFKENKE